jgi:hypothetical protein
MKKMRDEGLKWLGATALLFAAIQVLAPPAARLIDGLLPSAPVSELQVQLKSLQARLDELEARNNTVMPPHSDTPDAPVQSPQPSTPGSRPAPGNVPAGK